MTRPANKGRKRVRCIHCDGHHYVRKPAGDQVLVYFCKKVFAPYVVWIETR